MPATPSDSHRPFFQSAAWGTLCGLLAAIGYTACNACLRAVKDVDPFLVSAWRAVPTVMLLAPVVLVRPLHGLPLLPPPRVVGLLVVTGLLAHVAGNSLFQFGLAIVGMSLAVPLCLGSMIVCGATLGRVVLGEPVTPQMAVGLLFLVGSIVVLSQGATAAQRSVQSEPVNAAPSRVITADPPPSVSQLTLGVTAACVSGLFYAMMGATIRHATQGLSTVSQTLTIVSTAGAVALGGVSWFTVTGPEWAAISWQELFTMTLAGLLNALAFIALTRALQLTSLVYVHALNATQVTMAAVAGIVIFGEAMSEYLLLGLGLTVAGLVLMQGKKKVDEQSG